MLEFIQEHWSIIALVIIIVIAIAFMIPMAIYIAKYTSLKKKCSPYEENLDDVNKFLENKKMYIDAVAGQKECDNAKTNLEQCSKDKAECITRQEQAMKERDSSKQDLDKCIADKATCEKDKSVALSNINNSSAAVAACNKEKELLNAAKLSATTQLTQCNTQKQTCLTEKTTALATAAKNKTDFDACVVAKTTIQTNLDKCNTGLTTCNTGLNACNLSNKECQTKLASFPVPAPSNLVYKKLQKSYGSTGLCTDVPGSTQDSGAQLVGWTCHGNANQLFGYDSASKLLFAKHSGKCISSKNNKITQENCIKSPEKLWELNTLNDGTTQIINKATATPIYMNYAGALAPGVKMIATPTAQTFKLV